MVLGTRLVGRRNIWLQASFVLSGSLGQELRNVMDNCHSWSIWEKNEVQLKGTYSTCTIWFTAAHESSLSLPRFQILTDIAITGRGQGDHAHSADWSKNTMGHRLLSWGHRSLCPCWGEWLGHFYNTTTLLEHLRIFQALGSRSADFMYFKVTGLQLSELKFCRADIYLSLKYFFFF